MSEIEFLNNLKKFEPIIRIKSYKVEIAGLEPDDIQQEIRLKLFIKYPSFKGESSFNTWANKVANNCIIDLARKSKTITEKYLNESISLEELQEKDE